MGKDQIQTSLQFWKSLLDISNFCIPENTLIWNVKWFGTNLKQLTYKIEISTQLQFIFIYY